MRPDRFQIKWRFAGEHLAAIEPTDEELRAAAPLLAAAYNEPYNGSMMGNTGEMSVAEVAEHWLAERAAGARPLLLYCGGVLAGDCDLRRIQDRRAEFAILVAARAEQGRGLGTRFAIMAHVLAFEALALERVFVTILPANVPSRRLFEKLGYRLDHSPEARGYCDEDDDLSLSVERAEFQRLHGLALAEIEMRHRSAEVEA